MNSKPNLDRNDYAFNVLRLSPLVGSRAAAVDPDRLESVVKYIDPVCVDRRSFVPPDWEAVLHC